MIHPLWMMFLMLNTVFAVIGSAIVSNEYGTFWLPYFVVILNVVLVICIFFGGCKTKGKKEKQ